MSRMKTAITNLVQAALASGTDLDGTGTITAVIIPQNNVLQVRVIDANNNRARYFNIKITEPI